MNLWTTWNRLSERIPPLRKLAPWILGVALLGGYMILTSGGTPFKSAGVALSIPLRRGPFTVYAFSSKLPQTKALIVFGSGDWGWGGWEESVAYDLCHAGYAVAGIDCMAYAKTDYDLDTLRSDYGRITQTAEASLGLPSPPVIIGGFSMGAEQAVPVAAGPHPPAGMIGLLLVSPESRGRYGLRSSDQMDIPPTGPGTFAMTDFARAMGNLPIVQWHAALDFTDSTAWLKDVTAPHQLFVFPHALHNYNYGCVAFRRQLVTSVAWILNPSPQNAAAVGASS